MGDSRDAYVVALERQHQNDLATIARLKADVEDQQAMTRGFRRLFIEALRRCDRCETCQPRPDDN